MSEHYLLDLGGAIIGGIISGSAGIVVAWYSIKKRTEDEIKQSVYIPLYNGIMNLELEPKFYGTTDPTWSRLESHKKLKADSTIKQLYTKYEKIGHYLNELWVEWNNEYDKRREEFLIQIEKVFDKFGFYSEGGFYIKANYAPSISSFVNWFNHVLFDHEITTVNELYEKLLQYSKVKYPDFEDWLKNTHNQKPEFFKELFTTSQSIKATFPKNIDYEQLIKERDKAKEIIIKIRTELANKIK